MNKAQFIFTQAINADVEHGDIAPLTEATITISKSSIKHDLNAQYEMTNCPMILVDFEGNRYAVTIHNGFNTGFMLETVVNGIVYHATYKTGSYTPGFDYVHIESAEKPSLFTRIKARFAA
jgi:hypothetical protein